MSDISIPAGAVVRRLTRNLAERDHLLDLLAQVEAGHRLTNRLNEALLIVPEQTLADIRRVLGFGSPEDPTPEVTP